MKKVVLRAPVLTQSGYGVHSRQVARWLINLAEQKKISLSIQCVPWGDTSWFVNGDLHDGLVEKIMKYSSFSDDKADVSFQLILPNEWVKDLASYNVGMTAGVETTKCHPNWISSINQMNEIIVPSSHVRETFKNSGFLHKRVTVIPESFPDSLTTPPENLDLDLDTDFNILIFGQLTAGDPAADRKNIINTLKTLIATFDKNEDVGIVLKTNLGKTTILDYKMLQGTITKALKDMGHKGLPKIHILHGTMTDDEVRDLYHHPKIRALISLTRGEGFGLPILEAAACGLPIIATKWSSYRDFMKGDSYMSVKYDLVDIPKSRIDNNIFVEGAKWAEPNLGDASKILRNFHKYPTIYEKRAKKHKSFITENYSFKSIENLYSEHFKELLCL